MPSPRRRSSGPFKGYVVIACIQTHVSCSFERSYSLFCPGLQIFVYPHTTQSISKRATALRVGLENYERKKYAEARRNFALAKRYGLNDEDVHYKDVHACTMVWQADPTTEGLESCRKAFEWLLQSVPSSQVGQRTCA